jgi:hypothetical protein
MDICLTNMDKRFLNLENQTFCSKGLISATVKRKAIKQVLEVLCIESLAIQSLYILESMHIHPKHSNNIERPVDKSFVGSRQQKHLNQ